MSQQPTPRFTDNGDTVTDNTTGLVWTKATIAKDVTHEDAEAAAAAFGEGFRLPTAQELFGLIDHGRHNPAIDVDRFPDTRSTWYWTSNKCAWTEGARWVVSFYYGSVGSGHPDLRGCVRAVRPGQ